MVPGLGNVWAFAQVQILQKVGNLKESYSSLQRLGHTLISSMQCSVEMDRWVVCICMASVTQGFGPLKNVTTPDFRFFQHAGLEAPNPELHVTQQPVWEVQKQGSPGLWAASQLCQSCPCTIRSRFSPAQPLKPHHISQPFHEMVILTAVLLSPLLAGLFPQFHYLEIFLI